MHCEIVSFSDLFMYLQQETPLCFEVRPGFKIGFSTFLWKVSKIPMCDFQPSFGYMSFQIVSRLDVLNIIFYI